MPQQDTFFELDALNPKDSFWLVCPYMTSAIPHYCFCCCYANNHYAFLSALLCAVVLLLVGGMYLIPAALQRESR